MYFCKSKVADPFFHWSLPPYRTISINFQNRKKSNNSPRPGSKKTLADLDSTKTNISRYGYVRSPYNFKIIVKHLMVKVPISNTVFSA
jgi:hypothetical protein